MPINSMADGAALRIRATGLIGPRVEGSVRIAELDGVRGLAVLLILIWHYLGIPLAPAGIPLAPDRWVPSLKLCFILCRSGVDLFFVLSGFLITRILIDNIDSPTYYRTFFVRRACRILPLYSLLLLTFFGLRFGGFHGALLDGPISGWSYSTLTQNYTMAALGTYGAGWLGGTWSLAVEEQFYLIYPGAVRLVRRNWGMAWIVAVSSAVALRIWCYRTFGDGFAAHVWLPCRMDALLLGALVTTVVRDPDLVRNVRNCSRWLIAAFGLLCGTVAVLACCVARDIGYHMSMWGHSVLAMFYATALMLIVLYHGTRATGWLRGWALTGLGKVSYAVYLFHGIVLVVVFSIAGRPVEITDLATAAFIGVAFMLTLGASVLSFRYFEAPLIDLGHGATYRRAPVRLRAGGAETRPRP